MAKTIAEINEKIKKGKVVVVTAEEMKEIVRKKGEKKAADYVDVVTTATFGPMCSSGAYLNLPNTAPKIKLGGGKVYINGVPAYAGWAAYDIYIGATALPEDDPRNKIYPGEFKYGGGHVIEDLVRGKDLRLEAKAYGTDCYPQKRLDITINIKTIPQAILFNPRNAYQNYNVAVNLSNKIIYTYMGVLKPNLGNANYCSAGQLSPLLNDPFYKTIGIGTKVFLGGGIGFVCWSGTQHNPNVERTQRGVPTQPAGTLALIGDLKQMSHEFLRGVSILGYGVSLSVGIGVPIPILNEEMAFYTSVRDEEIFAPVIDYSKDYPESTGRIIAKVSYADLRKGKIKILNKEVPTASLSSYAKARQIAQILKSWIKEKKFFLTEPVSPLPFSQNYKDD